MGLEEVKNEILKKTEQEAQIIIQEGEEKAKEILADAEEQIRNYTLTRAEQTKNIVDMLERRELAQAEFDVRKHMLDKKKELIEEVIRRVKERLQKLPATKRKQYLNLLLQQAKKEIDVKIVHANEEDIQLMKGAGGITFKKRALVGGILTETGDGMISIDYSYDEKLSEIKEKALQEIGGILFK